VTPTDTRTGTRTEVRLLLVEDESIIALDLRQRLASLGYTVAGFATSKDEALVQAEALRPDLVLMDIMLKGQLGGIEAARWIRDRLQIPVIYVTGYADEGTLDLAKTADPFGYIVKPFDDRDLHATIEVALHKHRAHREVEENRLWFATTLRCIADAVIATDAAGTVRFVNRAAESLTGYREGDALGRGLGEVFAAANGGTVPENVRRLLDEVRRGRAADLHDDTFLLARDGSRRNVEGVCAPIRVDGREGDDAFAGAVLAVRDVTEKRKLEVEVVRAQKLEALGLLAGGIAHDFNNILTAIVGNLALARLSLDAEHPAAVLLEEVDKASRRAAELSRQFLTFSRGGEPLRRIVSVARIVAETASCLVRGTKARLELDLPEDLWPAEVDETQISQVVSNLVLNAIQAMADGGTLEVRASNQDVEPDAPASGSTLRPGHYVRVSVRDTGCGIGADALGRIFDPYFTTKRASGAVGLGLTTVYSILRRHGGHVTVDSAPGAGSTFTFSVPAAPGATIPVPPVLPDALRGSGRVLVMDDERAVREAARRMLEHLGYEVVAAVDGEEAVAVYGRARREGRPFDLVILDLTVPGGLGGREALPRLLDLDPQVRAIVSSGYSSDPLLANYRDHGFRGRLAKPYEPSVLGRTVREALAT